MNHVSTALHTVKTATVEATITYLQSHQSFATLKLSDTQFDGIKQILNEYCSVVVMPKKKRMTKEEKAALVPEKTKDTPFANFMSGEKLRLKALHPDAKPKEIHERAMDSWKQQKDTITESAKAVKKAAADVLKAQKAVEKEALKAQKMAEKEAAKAMKAAEKTAKKAGKKSASASESESD